MASARCLLIGTALLVAWSLCAAQSGSQDGRIHLDIVVSDASEIPVQGLQAKDFTIFDEGKERQIATFAAFDGVTAISDPPAQMIIVIDSVNSGFIEMGYLRQGLEEYLRENEGRLRQPTTIARLVPSGIQVLSQPSLDGNVLANIVDQVSATVKPRGLDALQISLNALVTIAKKEVGVPGRKLLVWLGPGWPTPVLAQPLTAVDQRNQRTYYLVAVQIAKLLYDARMVLYGGYTAGEFYMREFLKPIRKISDVDPRVLRLNVLAIKSGGKGELPETNRDSVVRDVLKHFVAWGNSYYSLSFDPPKAHGSDEFHELRVVVNRPGLAARTISGYYNEREHSPPEGKKEVTVTSQKTVVTEPHAAHLMTVAQLTELVDQTKDERDGDAAMAIEQVQLTERLSSGKLNILSARMPGAKAKAALMAVGDASVFLEPPASEIPDKAVPSPAEQREIAARAVEYLKNIIPKLPNFSARRRTTSFEEISDAVGAKSARKSDGVLRKAGEFKATVLFRDGKEVARAEGVREQRLITQGTFGPILSTAIVDAAHSSTEWSRWEEGSNGSMAVLRFRVPLEKSHYEVSFPSVTPGGGEFAAMAPTAYHGEIGIDPSSGKILRLVLEADPASRSSMHRADIMVEYGSVVIGGRMYTCPLRSVSISAGKTLRLVDEMGLPAVAEMGEITRLDDVVFSDYHVFRSEMRIVPE